MITTLSISKIVFFFLKALIPSIMISRRIKFFFDNLKNFTMYFSPFELLAWKIHMGSYLQMFAFSTVMKIPS